jgi:serine/threonine-protein kinase RsbW
MGNRISETVVGTTAIGVRVPAETGHLIMLRALAETVALIADFGIDEVTDIRLALDEVATSLILDAVPGSTLDCEFRYGDDRMFVRVGSVTAMLSAIGEDSFSWHIVRTLTDSVTVTREPYDGLLSGYPTVVDFTWVRAPDNG